MLDQMFRGTAAASPEAAQAVNNVLSNVAAPAVQSRPQQPSASTSIASGLTMCSNIASFNSLLASNDCFVAMFTRDGCGPCRTIKPIFEDLAVRHLSSRNSASNAMQKKSSKKIAFALVDTTISPSVTSKYTINAVPTFLFFLKGNQVSDAFLSCGILSTFVLRCTSYVAQT